MKCLIIGGGGFLGSHLTDGLLADGHAVRVFDRPNLQRFRTFHEGESVEWIEGDFLDREQVDRVVEGCDAVYHLVSTTLPRSSNENPAYDIQTNVVGTLHLLESALRHRIRRFVFVSSGGTVYGKPLEVPILESHPTEPICSYGIGKLAIEKYLHLHRLLYDLDYCVLRLANPYGERQRVAASQGAVAVFLHQALRDEEIRIWGDGSVVRDYFYVEDATRALISAISYNGEHRVFNIGSGVGNSLNDIVAAIESLIGRPVRRAYLPGRAFDVPVSVLDISRARQHLAWHPRVSLTEGLSRTARWLERGR